MHDNGTMQWLSTTEDAVPEGLGWLSPLEASRIEDIRFTKRRTEYLLRRAVGKLAATRRHSPIRAPRMEVRSRWTREENIRRYRRLLTTQLTDMERSFIERRLTEELRG